MKLFFSFIVLLVIAFGCKDHNNHLKKVDKNWLDAVIKNSDSSYKKTYYRSDFVKAYYYINRKDSSVCQVMKDSAESIRQIIMVKKNIRTYYAQYYPNGQLMAELPLDDFGQYHGKAIYYFSNEGIQSSGEYKHGLKTGPWRSYNESGKLVSIETFDENGKLISTALN